MIIATLALNCLNCNGEYLRERDGHEITLVRKLDAKGGEIEIMGEVNQSGKAYSGETINKVDKVTEGSSNVEKELIKADKGLSKSGLKMPEDSMHDTDASLLERGSGHMLPVFRM